MSEKLLGIIIIDEAEECVFQPFVQTKPEVKIIYRRMPETEQGLVRMKHTKDDRNGKADENLIADEVLRYGLVRFEGIFLKDRSIAPATVENVRKLDAWIIERLLLLICGRVAGYVHVPLSVMSESSLNSK